MSNKEVLLENYRPTNFDVQKVHLTFELYEDHCLVTNCAKYSKKKDSSSNHIFLNGESLELIDFSIDGHAFKDYLLKSDGLEFNGTSDSFELLIVTKIYPQKNLSLMGLYKSSGIFCTQMEAEGFRKVTYFFDRPDVLTRYTVKIIADNKYPFLLSNGNQIAQGKLSGDRHFCEWEDPAPKPSYLFALVAGDFDVARDQYVTTSGRKVALEIYVDKGNLDQCDYALTSLKESMKWDEDVFDLEYDLDVYMIVAVDSFNMGAMENKGLNVFNSKYVLGNKETATDRDIYNIQAVIGHEYFHNWTGNRVTCRDWFQLTLKEGLTVFRDQEFSADLNSRVVKRIDDVNDLRSSQFLEDASDFSHPIKPKSYIEIDNFYTLTIYEKGAEVIRMYETILGRENFIKAVKFYLKENDGTAATTEDFLKAMQAFTSVDLTQFALWYDTARTPLVKMQKLSDGAFSLEQSGVKNILSIPLKFKGPLSLSESQKSEVLAFDDHSVLLLNDKKIEIQVAGDAYPSLNRGFSAPINLDRSWEISDYLEALKHEDDSFNIWDYSQEVLKKSIRGEKGLDNKFIEFIRSFITNNKNDAAFKAQLLRFPSQGEILEMDEVYNFDKVFLNYRKTKKQFVNSLYSELLGLYQGIDPNGEWSAESMGRRSLRNTILSLLSLDDRVVQIMDDVESHYQSANMTDKANALNVINQYNLPIKRKVNEDFLQKFQSNSLVLTKYFQAVACGSSEEYFAELKAMISLPEFKITIPNHIYASLRVLGEANPEKFHISSGEGYFLMAEKILEIDKFNPQVAARIAKSFKPLKRLPEKLRNHCLNAQKSILENKELSNNTFEIISKNLKL